MAKCVMTDDRPFQVLKQLGGGGYGMVQLVDHSRLGRVAYKTCPGDFTDRKKLEEEAELHRFLRHPNIIILYETVFNSTCCGLFIEYMKYGAVIEFIKRFNVPPDLRIQIIYEIACGMFYLHSNRPIIIHGDLSSQNILIGDGFHAKIADFGLSLTLRENYENSKTVTPLSGKHIYIAPEYFSDSSKRKSEKFDVYGFAILAWEILSQNRAYHKCTNKSLIPIFVERGERPDMKELVSIPSTVKKLIEKCWHKKDKKRPAFGIIKDELFVHVSHIQSELQQAYASLMDQEKNIHLSNDNAMYGISDSMTITWEENTREINRSTDTSVLKNLDGLCSLRITPGEKEVKGVPFEYLEVDRSDIRLVRKLGSGQFSEVFFATWKGNLDVAVKTPKSDCITMYESPNWAKITHKLQHPKIVQLMGVCTKTSPMYIITEFMCNGALRDYLRDEKKGKLLIFPQLVYIAAQIADGMAYIERQDPSFVHRNLRAANVLVGENNTVKVADFNYAGELVDGQYTASKESKFPVKWTSPEAAHEQTFSVKSDVWSYGILLYEIVTYGRIPYAGMDAGTVLHSVSNGYRLQRPVGKNYDCPPKMYDIMLKCWDTNPVNRPTFDYLHTFFDDYDTETEEQNRPL